MQLYKQGQQRPKWKDPKTFNVETQIQADACEVGVRESIGPWWS
jgi:hypothetical protein